MKCKYCGETVELFAGGQIDASNNDVAHRYCHGLVHDDLDHLYRHLSDEDLEALKKRLDWSA